MEEDYSEHYNPYTAGKALKKDEDFFGREDIIRQVKITLESKQNNMVVLYGQRRIGKTSILNKLERSLANPPFFVINFDLRDKARRPISEVLYDLASICAKKAEMGLVSKDVFLSNPDAFHNTFLPTLYEKLGKTKKLVLLFDEFDVLDESEEKLPETAAANAFHKYIRQLDVDQLNIHFVFVVGRRMEELGEKFLSTFKEAKSIPVFVLNEKDTIALIKRGENERVSFEKEAIDQIIFYTRGHPFFTQLLCQEIFNHITLGENNQKQIVTKKLVEGSLHSAIEKGEGQFVWIWKGLPPAEQIVFSAIAENIKQGEVLTDEGIAKILQQAGIKLLARELNIAPSKLVEWNMLEKIGGGYRFYFEILRTWVEENQKLDKVKGELEKISPHAELLYQTAFSYYRQNNTDQSLLRLQDALEANPNHIKARLLYGTILYERKEYVSAINELKQAHKFGEIEARRLLVNTMLEYGALLEDQGNVEAAEKIYNEIIEDVFKNEETALQRRNSILIKRGDKFKANGEYLLAFEAYNLASDANEVAELIKELSLVASQFESEGKINEAADVYSILAKTNATEEQWRFKAGELRKLIKQLKEIETNIQELSRLLHTEGDTEVVKKMLGRIRHKLDGIDFKYRAEAIESLRQRNDELIQLFHAVTETKIAYEKGDLSSASLMILKLVKDYSESHFILELSQKIEEETKLIQNAKNYYQAGDIATAKNLLDKARRNNPKIKEVHDLLNDIEMIEGNIDEAIQSYKAGKLQIAEDISKQVLRIHPANNEALNLQQQIQEIKSAYKKAKTAYDQGDLKSAIALVDTALLKYPLHNESVQLKKQINEMSKNLELAESAYKTQDFITSQKYLENALEIQSSNAKAIKLLKDVKKKLNRMQQQSRWLPTVAIVAIISSCGTLLIGMGVLFNYPAIAELFIPNPTPTMIATTPASSTEVVPTMDATEVFPTTFPTTAPTSSGQLFDSNRFAFLPLSSVLKTDGSSAPYKTATDNLQLTPGYHVLAGIPVDFKYEIFTQNEGSSDYPQNIILPTNVQNPLAAYFLIQADWGYARFDGKQIGKMVLNFDNGQFEYPLVMGLNIRDWTRGVFPAAVTEITSQDIVYAWEGTAPDGRAGGMDLLKVAIPAEYQSSKLTSIEIIDTSLETTGEINAGIRILSVSIEMQDETPGPWEYQIEQVPATDTSLAWFLNTNDTLILTGGSLQYQDFNCIGGGNTICVLVIISTKNTNVTISNLVPNNNWLAVTRSVSPDDAVNNVTSEFWLSPNCGAGCSFATVGIFNDGVLINSYKINNPNQ